ncbi:MAG: Npt1/Npt2 family nucleotide transporter [Pseudomonadota bacterium]
MKSWTLKSNEISVIFCLSLMIFLSLFNYSVLRVLKDSLVVPNIGAEAISFIKFFCIIPTACLLVISYIKLLDKFSFRMLYIIIASSFLIFFLIFGFILYPNQELIHPSTDMINNLMQKNLDFLFFKISFLHFKWFLLIANKWSYVLFYVVAELWSIMYVLLFWQLANQITTTKTAKKYYSFFAFIGSLGTLVAGSMIKLSSDDGDALQQIKLIMLILSLTSLVLIFTVEFLVRRSIKDEERLSNLVKKTSTKSKGLIPSLRLIFSSRYLGYITILIIAYGVALNLIEGPWKASIRNIYPDTHNYMSFMASVNQWTGGISMIIILLGAYIINKYSWFFAAIITPVVFLFIGIIFFTILILNTKFNIYLSNFFDPLIFISYAGMIQIVLGKSTKYALFDITKEMVYIPVDKSIRNKGRAAVDMIGSRLSKGFATLIQASIFIVFPTATYLTISKTLMICFVLIVTLWIVAVFLLNKDYLEQLKLT